MYCKNCGKENGPGAAFCIVCGTPLPAVPVYQPNDGPTAVFTAPKKKNIAALALGALSVVLAIALVLSMTGVLGAAGGAIASKSFGTPEDAINYFVERFIAGDFSGAMSACAINEIAEGFDYEAWVERVRAFMPLTISYLPSKYPQYVEYNKARTEQQIMGQMAYFAVSFNLSEEYAGIIDGQTIPLQGEELPDGMIEQLDPAAMSGLKLVDIGKMGVHDSVKNRENQKKMAKSYGADDMQFRTVLYEYEGNYYVGGFTIVEYDGKWLIQNMSDPIAGISVFGVPMPVADKQTYYDSLK